MLCKLELASGFAQCVGFRQLLEWSPKLSLIPLAFVPCLERGALLPIPHLGQWDRVVRLLLLLVWVCVSDLRLLLFNGTAAMPLFPSFRLAPAIPSLLVSALGRVHFGPCACFMVRSEST